MDDGSVSFNEIFVRGLTTQESRVNNMNARAWNLLVNAVLIAEKEVADNPWPTNEAGEEMRNMMVCNNIAREGLTAARDALRSAMQEAEWGACGSAFVTKNFAWPNGDGITVTLWVNHRRRASMTDSGYITVVDPKVAKQERLASRARARAEYKMYAELRERLAQDLAHAGVLGAMNFKEYEYFSGQEGGYFRRPLDQVSISARGVLRRAAEIRQEILEEREDELLGLADEVRVSTFRARDARRHAAELREECV